MDVWLNIQHSGFTSWGSFQCISRRFCFHVRLLPQTALPLTSPSSFSINLKDFPKHPWHKWKDGLSKTQTKNGMLISFVHERKERGNNAEYWCFSPRISKISVSLTFIYLLVNKSAKFLNRKLHEVATIIVSRQVHFVFTRINDLCILMNGF